MSQRAGDKRFVDQAKLTGVTATVAGALICGCSYSGPRGQSCTNDRRTKPLTATSAAAADPPTACPLVDTRKYENRSAEIAGMDIDRRNMANGFWPLPVKQRLAHK